MQTAKSTLKLKVPVSVVTPILKKQVVVCDKQVVAQAPKPESAKLTRAKSVKPSVSCINKCTSYRSYRPNTTS